MSFRPTTLALLFTVPFSYGLPAQLSSPTSQSAINRPARASYALDGVVINSVTKEPVRAALVQIVSGQRLSLLTGPDGKFHFAGLPQGQLRVEVRKPGFFSEQDLSQGPFPLPLIQVGPNMPAVVLSLAPEGVIYGRITDFDDAPLERLQVRLTYEAVVNGRKTWQQQGGKSTGDDGDFRFYGLRPGTYYICALPSGPRPATDGRLNLRPEGYAIRYYATASDLDSATPIIISPAKQVRADMAIKRETLYQVSGAFEGAPPNAGVNIQVFSQSGEPLSSVPRNTMTARFQTLLATGSYVLKAYARGGNMPVSVGILPIRVASDTAGLQIAIAPSAVIPVTVRTEFARPESETTRKDRQFVSVQLVPAVPGAFGSAAQSARVEGPTDDRSLTVRDLEPGVYRAQISPTGPWYVESARWQGESVMNRDIEVQAGGLREPIEIVLRDDFATLKGSVSLNGHPVGALVVLVPTSDPQGAIVVPVSATGQFQKNLLPPGEYRGFAFDQVDRLEFTSPKIMGAFPSQLIQLPGNGQASVDLELQTRAN